MMTVDTALDIAEASGKEASAREGSSREASAREASAREASSREASDIREKLESDLSSKPKSDSCLNSTIQISTLAFKALPSVPSINPYIELPNINYRSFFIALFTAC
jgi:hypothetical protein